MRAALKVYEKLGATLEEVSLPHSPYALAAYYLVATAEASSNLARYDGMHYGHRTKEKADLIDTYAKSRGEGFGKEVKRRIMLGTYVLSSGYKDAYYLKALKVRRLIKNDFDEAFATCDVIDGPDDADGRRSRSARSPTTRWRCTCRTSTRSSCNLAGIAGHEHPVRVHEGGPADRPATPRRRRSRRRSCCASPGCTRPRPTGTRNGRRCEPLARRANAQEDRTRSRGCRHSSSRLLLTSGAGPTTRSCWRSSAARSVRRCRRRGESRSWENAP